MKETIEFKNMIFRKGFNITIRKGKKWMKKNISNINIILKQVKLFKDINNTELRYLHDHRLNTKKKLLKEMQKYYSNFTENSLITVIWFTIDK